MNIKKGVLVSVIMAGTLASLVGCQKKITVDTINSEYYTYMNGISSVQYSAKTDLDLSSVIYGEKFEMSWDSVDKIDRMLSTGDLASVRNVSAKALENTYSESVTNYVTGGKRYATYDGSAFFVTDYNAAPEVSKGPLRIIDEIMSDANKSLSTQTGELNGVMCNMITGTLTGPYLPYLFDDVNMTGLLDFKSQIDKEIKINYYLYTSMEDKHPVQLALSIKNCESLLEPIVAGMDSSNSENTETDVELFDVIYNFTAFNQINAIVLPDGASNATETDNIDSLSLSAVESSKLDSEANRDVKIGGFTIQLPDSWSPVDVVGVTAYDGADSTGKAYKVTRLKHKFSESYVQIYNPVTLDKLVDKLSDGGIDTTGFAEAVEADTETAVEAVVETATEYTYNTDLIKEGVVQYYSKQDYDSVGIDGNPSYIMSTKGDSQKEYIFIIIGDGEFVEVKVSLDGAELYRDYYDTVVANLASTFGYAKQSLVVDNTQFGEQTLTEAEIETTPGDGESGTDSSVDALSGTIRNPYAVNEQILMKGIDLSSGNIINEYAVIKSINTDKLLVSQKLKESGLTTDGDAALVNIVITTDKVKHTDTSELDLIMTVSLVDKDGNDIGAKLNDGKPLNKELQDGIIFTSDNETKQVVFAFEMPENFDETSDMLKIQYNDPDLGDRSVYAKLK